MKSTSFFLGTVALFTSPILAQVSGNGTYNDNNRFKMNATYQAQAVPAASADYEPSKRKERAQYSSDAGRQMNSQQYYGSNGYDAVMQQVNNTNATYMNGNEVVMAISVLNNAEPTGYNAIFHLNQAGKKIQELDSLIEKRIKKFIQLSKELGVKPTDFYVDMIALVPIFEKEKKIFSKTYTEVPKGFEMQKNIHVRYTKPEQLDRLFTMAAQCEIYDLIKVEYLYDSVQTATQKMRAKADEVMKERLKHFAKAGIRLDTCFKTIYESQNQYFPVDQYVHYQPLAVSALEEETSTEAGGSSAKIGGGRPQRSTLFHNQISTRGFDAIINPSPKIPGIQMVYNMEIRFRLNQPVQTVTKTINQTKALIITPQGTIREEYIVK